MTSRVIQKGDAIGVINEIAKNFSGWKVAAGVIGGTHSSGKISMPELAAIFEFGAPVANIPQRSFIQEGARRAENKVRQALRYLPVRPEAALQAKLTEVGAILVSEMKDVFHNNNWPGNAPNTIKRKGFDEPGFETGELMNAPTFKVYKERV